MKRVGLVAGALALVVGAFALVTPSAYAASGGAATCTWTGTAGDSKFSTATNWSGCNNVAPQTGDIILLPYISTTAQTLTNDLPQGTLLGGLTIDSKSSSATDDYGQYTVDKFAFGDGAVLKKISGFSVGITGSVATAGAVTFIGGNAGRMFSATTADVIIAPAGNVTIQDVPASCAGGGGTADHYVYFKPTGQVTLSNAAYSMAGTESSMVVGAKSTIFLPSSGTYAGNITFNGGGAVQGVDCTDESTYSMGVFNDMTLSGTITLNGGDILYYVDSGKTLTVTGIINGNGSGLKAYSGSTGTFVNNASQNNSTTPGGSQTVAMQVLPAITDSQPDVDLNVKPNTTVTFDGVRRNGFVADKSVLMGAGTFNEGLYVSQYATVAPGHSPGCITADTLSLYGTYSFELGGSAACTGYDQLVIKNASNSTTAVTLGYDDGATMPTLVTSRFKNYTPKQGDVFVIINQSGTAAVKGTFAGLAEGTTFTQNGIVFKISYKGGDGNDVTLTVMNKPTAPNTGFALIQANPVVSGIALAIVAGLLVLIGRKLQATRR